MVKKLVILIKYEPFTDVFQRLNLHYNNNFFPEQLLVTASVYQASEYLYIKQVFQASELNVKNLR